MTEAETEAEADGRMDRQADDEKTDMTAVLRVVTSGTLTVWPTVQKWDSSVTRCDGNEVEAATTSKRPRVQTFGFLASTFRI